MRKLTQLQTVAVSAGLVKNTDKAKYMKIKETASVANTDTELNGQNFGKA
jgi:hypothetical protein